MSIENFVYYNILMATFTWFLHYRHGETQYDNGFMDAVQLHQEGRLTYSVTDDAGVKTILIEVSDYEE